MGALYIQPGATTLFFFCFARTSAFNVIWTNSFIIAWFLQKIRSIRTLSAEALEYTDYVSTER